MRPLPPEAGQDGDRLSPPPTTTTTTATCDPHTCTWQPYATSGDFEANAAVVIILLLCALICGLALNAAIRCSQRRSRLPESTHRKPNPVAGAGQRVEPPTLVFSAGMKLAGVGVECAICLSEFVDGEGIRVLGSCNHGFHVHCIHQWLSSHSSCPTCRAPTCLPSSPSPHDAPPPVPPPTSTGVRIDQV
ncbi:hypothetical protein L1049_023268 [Liquidambar formosana]|uniref:RING-type E3 ubiquitin transferase n=1 Tax=Liquidambar formosana TaxID=63359 RepID=A0AAP0WPR4_LIQFO